jgi:hypothetical protein
MHNIFGNFCRTFVCLNVLHHWPSIALCEKKWEGQVKIVIIFISETEIEEEMEGIEKKNCQHNLTKLSRY